MNKIRLFVGPTLYDTGLDSYAGGDIEWVPPVRRGDIDKLVADVAAPGIIGLADGTFHAYPSVSHAELRRALEAGWTIYGLCSMGAIRAAEMAHLGLKPWGRVAKIFCEDPEFADDEVTLVHGTDAPYFPISEPMVHIREFLRHMEYLGALTAEQAEAVRTSMHQRWYGDRTFAELHKALNAVLPNGWPLAVKAGMDDFTPYRIKQQDLLNFVQQKPWLAQ